MTLLTLVQNACKEIGITAPTLVVGSTDVTVQQLLALANREGKDLTEMGQWPQLIRVATITTADGQTEYDLPSDYGRQIERTMWDTGQRWPVLGPMSQQEYQAVISSGFNVVPPGSRYLIMRASTSTAVKVYLNPTPSDIDTVPYRYVSSHWCSDASGATTYSSWQADTNVGILPEDLMTEGLIWRWRKAKGLEYADDFALYERRRDRIMGQGRPSPTLNLTPYPRYPLIGPWNVPNTGYS